MTPEQITQLGLSAIFAIACVQLFLRLETKNDKIITMLVDQNTELRKANRALEEQNKLLSIAMFSNNPDAMRAYGALQKTIPTGITDLEGKGI